MNAAPSRARGISGGDLAFVATVLAAYGSLVFDRPADFTPARWAVLAVLGVLYTLIGTVGDRVNFGLRGLPRRVTFLAVLVGLGCAILYLSELRGFMSVIIFPLFSQAVLDLPGRLGYAACAVIVLAFAVVLAALANWPVALGNVPLIIAGAIFVVVFTQIALRERAARTEVERLAGELRAANERLRAYAIEAEELATTQERNRLAREIHDSLGHYLTVINVQLEAAQVVLTSDPPRALEALRHAQSLAQEGLADVRRSVAALRAAPGAGRPLAEAIGRLAEECRQAGIVVRLDVQGQPRPLAPEADQALYRAAQEALTNVRKHARASRADLTLDYGHGDGSPVRLVVADNGVGAQAPDGGFGLLGLRERVQLAGGKMNVRTAVGEGFCIEVEVPGSKDF